MIGGQAVAAAVAQSRRVSGLRPSHRPLPLLPSLFPSPSDLSEAGFLLPHAHFPRLSASDEGEASGGPWTTNRVLSSK